MRRVRSCLAPALLLVAVLLGVMVFLVSSRGLNEIVRPAAVFLMESRTGKTISLEALDRTPTGIRIGGLSLSDSDGSRFDFPRIDVEYSLAELVRLRLRAVTLYSPRIEVVASGKGGHTEPGRGKGLAEAPGLRIASVAVRDGMGSYRSGEQLIAVRNVNFEMVNFPRGPIGLSLDLGREAEGVQLAVKGHLDWDRTAVLEIGHAALDGRRLVEKPVRVNLSPGGVAGEGGVRLDLVDSAMVRDLAGGLGFADPLPENVEIEARGIGVDLGFGTGRAGAMLETGIAADSLEVCLAARCFLARTVQTTMSKDEGGVTFAGSARLAGQGIFEAQGSGGGESYTVRLHASLPDLRDLFGSIGVSGAEQIAGGIEVSGECGRNPGEISCGLELKGTEPGAGERDYIISLRGVAGETTISRTSEKGWSGTAEISLADSAAIGGSFAEDRFTWQLKATSGVDAIGTVLARGRVPGWLKGMDGVEAVGTLARGRDGQWTGNVSANVETISISHGTFSGSSIDLDLSTGERGVSFDRISAKTRTGEGLPAGTWSAEGSGAIGGGRTHFDFQKITGSGIEYLTADGLAGMSGGNVTLSLGADRGMDVLGFALQGKADVGDVLAGEVYGDLRGIDWHIALQGSLPRGSNVVSIENAMVEAGDLFGGAFHGIAGPQDFDLEGTLNVKDAQALASRYLVPALAPVMAVFKDLKAGGGVGADIHLKKGPNGLRVGGTLYPRDLELSIGSLGLNIVGAVGNLPFEIASGGTATPSGQGEADGRLRVGSLQVGPLEFANDSLAIRSRMNGFLLPEPVTFRIAGGKMVADFLNVERGQKGLSLETRVAVNDVDLTELTKTLGTVPLTGSISADLGTIRYAEGVLASDGEASVHVFGGNVRVGNLYMQEPFSRYRSMNADVEFSGLDLYSLSHTFEFGEVNGVADGFVHDLRVFGNIPSKFVARFMTRDEGKRDISVKALNNLTVISQGGVSAALSRGVYKFIDFYRYRRIGIDCRLENDVFQLRGTALEGSNRYLVHGSLIPPRIDIIAPEQAISFKELVKRVGRIQRGGSRPVD